MLAEHNLRLFLLLPLFLFGHCPHSDAVCSPSVLFTWRNNLLSPWSWLYKNQARLCTKICDAFKKKIVTATERRLGELINVTFFYIYEQNLMNSCSMTVFIPFLMQQPIHTVARVSLRLLKILGSAASGERGEIPVLCFK